ncbi:MAG: hypothetical protein QXJ14_00165 [Candidatus Aenigmatarchaeota archaeon]
MRAAIIFSILMLAMFLSGCISLGGQKAIGVGLVVKSFRIDPSTIEARNGQKMYVTLEIQNNGGVQAKNISATLNLGADFQGGGDIDIKPNTLAPANPALGIKEGEVAYGTATITYNGGEKRSSISYPVLLRLTYDYSTVVEGLIKAVSPEYYRQTKEVGGIQQFTQTSGPIQAELVMPTTVIGGDSDIRIHLYLKDIGGGRSYVGDITENLGKVEISGDCSGSYIIPPGGKALVTCSLGKLPPGQLFSTKSFKITISYSYFLDLHSSITVLPSTS